MLTLSYEVRANVGLPLVVVTVSGQGYFVSMPGDDVHWVRTVRAAGGRAALVNGGREQVRLDESVPAERRAAIFKAYLQRAPGARPHMPVTRDAPLSEFEKVRGAFPIFRVVSEPEGVAPLPA